MATRAAGSSLPSSPVIFGCVCGSWQSAHTAAFLLPAASATWCTLSSVFLYCSSWHCWQEV